MSKLAIKLSTVEDSIRKLDNCLKRNGWSGYDPCDVKGISFFIRIQRFNRWLNKMLRRFFFEIESIDPITLRRVLNVKKE